MIILIKVLDRLKCRNLELFGIAALKDKLVFLDVDVDPYEHVYPMLEAGNAMDHMRLSKDEKTW